MPLQRDSFKALHDVVVQCGIGAHSNHYAGRKHRGHGFPPLLKPRAVSAISDPRDEAREKRRKDTHVKKRVQNQIAHLIPVRIVQPHTMMVMENNMSSNTNPK